MSPRVLLLLGAACAALALLAPAPRDARGADRECVPVGAWVAPGADGKTLAAADVLGRAAKRSIVLLGESHTSAEHHRWQLQTLAALRQLRPEMVIGFEMFPRRAQPVLDRWVAGELTEEQFLAQTDWRNVWRMDPQLYMPLFHFARMNRIPMLALNVEQGLTREVGQKGYDGVAAERREGVGRPAAPSEAYLAWLLPIFNEHQPAGEKGRKADRDDPAFRRFVESQQVWDRAMAEPLASAAKRERAPLVVGVMGAGHVMSGFGVPHQLRDLGVTEVMSLLPWDRGTECKTLVPGVADAVFGVAAPAPPQGPPRPRLGVYLDTGPEGVRIKSVEQGSVAEAAGLKEGDLFLEVAAMPVKEFTDIGAVVQRMPPGTWMPLKVRRGAETLDLVAKFPPAAK